MNAELLKRFEAEILTWPGVEKESRADGIIGEGEVAIYTIGGRHIGHIHHDDVADIEFPRAVRDELVAKGEAEPHRGGFRKVVSFRIKNADDIPELIGLFRTSYEHKKEAAARRAARQR